MSAIDNIPENQNFLSPLNFKFTIKKCPHVNFFAQKANVPGISNQPATESTPFVTVPKTGDHILFEELVVTFMVDEALKNWLEIFNWIRELGFPENHLEYKAIQDRPTWLGQGIKSDISLIILDSNKQPKFECLLIDAHPVSLSSLPFDSTLTDVQYIQATAMFRYTNYRLNILV